MISGMFVVENIVSRQNAECQKKSIYILEVSKNIWVNPVFGLIEIRKLTMLGFTSFFYMQISQIGKSKTPLHFLLVCSFTLPLSSLVLFQPKLRINQANFQK